MRTKGFSLIELLIVVAIILIIAAIAVPNLLRARIAANEASAASSVRKIATAEYAYSSAYPAVGYSSNLLHLGGPAAGCTPGVNSACILDNLLSSGNKSGYQFNALGFPQGSSTINVSFVAGSAPEAFNLTGVRYFCTVDDGVLRADPGTAGNPPIATVAGCTSYPMTP